MFLCAQIKFIYINGAEVIEAKRFLAKGVTVGFKNQLLGRAMK